MLVKELFVDILVMHKQGNSIRSIAIELGVSRNTVRHYISNPQVPEYKKRADRGSILDPYKPYILQRIEAAHPQWIPATVLFDEVKKQGYPGGITVVRDFVATQKPKVKADPLVRFETEPGKQMQIDFTTIRRGKRTLKAFVATLGYSRACYVHFYDNERSESWMDGIVESFHYFGGVPAEILCDNAKALVIERNAYDEGKHRWNPTFLQLSKDYGFKIKACRPYRAKTKGKVERFNHYLKNSFVVPLAATLRQCGLDIESEHANAKIRPWLQNVAHQRIHGTTGEKAQVLLTQEQAHLSPIPVLIETFIEGETNASPAVPPAEVLQHQVESYDQYMEGDYEPIA
ncbi:MAG: IS21 family transposase [Desulfobulbaceae bacterium]|nr:IS21 family transposase [Desulfobulbaceae bacterium]